MKKYHKAKGRSRATFIMLRHDIMDSNAYIALSAKARCILHEIMRRYNGYNNGEIPLGCRDVANRLPISKDTASKGFDELLTAGFIKENKDNFFYVASRKVRRWALTFESVDGKRPTNEWKK